MRHHTTTYSFIMAAALACILSATTPPSAEAETNAPSLLIGRSGADFLFTWPSKTGMVYDLLFDNDLFGTTSPDSWPVYMEQSGMAATLPSNSLAVPYPPEDPEGFFALRERPEPVETNNLIKVFLLGGQSNMMGSNTIASDLPAALQVPQTDVLFFYGNYGNGTISANTLMSLQPGGGLAFGPEITFGRDIADAFPSESFALIKLSPPATNLENDWDPVTGPYYSEFRTTVTNGLNALENAGYTVEIVGMLWTQGERDAKKGFEATYEANLTEFIADIRSRYGANLPFFISQLSSQQTNIPADLLAQVRQAQMNVAAADSNSYLIVTDTFEIQTVDYLHFSSAGQQSLGQAFADAYIAIP